MKLGFYLMLSLLFYCQLISCSGNGDKSSASNYGEHSKILPSEIFKEQLDFKKLFELAEQEELELYNVAEELLLANENVQQLSSKEFVQSLLPELEEGVKRRILNGVEQGLPKNPGIDMYIIIDTNIPDDSLESDIRFIEIRKTLKAWSLSSVTSVWRCYKDRGHEDYSTVPCD